MKQKNIAIKGDFDRGDEVIAELEKLGGINKFRCSGTSDVFYYYIGYNSMIYCAAKDVVEDYFQRNNDFRTYHKTVGQYYTLSGYKRMKRRAKIKSSINKIFNKKHE